MQAILTTMGALLAWLTPCGSHAQAHEPIAAAAPVARIQDGQRAADDDDDDTAVPACKTTLRLSGVVYQGARAERSFALFHVRPDHAGEVYRAGMWVGSYRIEAVEPRAVLLRGREGECELRLVGDGSVRGRPAASPAARKAAQRAKPRKSEVVVIGQGR